MDPYPSSSRHTSTSPTARSSSTKSSASRSSTDTQNLLAPVVRSKRTPIACTECRRRQVKCTGTTPKCERCEKRGMKCEYIPCSQQKAASNDSPPPQTLPSAGVQNQPTRQYSLDQYPSQQWQSGIPLESGYTPYNQMVDWQGHPSQRNAILQQPRYGGQGLHTQPLDGSSYGQSTYSHQQSYNMTTASGSPSYAQRPIVPSQQSYGGSMGVHSGYMTSDLSLGSNSLNYGYGSGGQAMGNTFGVTSAHSYPGEYYHADTDTFDPTAVGMVSSDPSIPYGDAPRPF